ncbi:MAG: 5'-nucleotidase C-terminal domain-containing protein [Alphaproteobacteria bacterium]|nr:5'-nucleotidase C-terminal domain-containing protein [Alphaproteobacteria bacterium]
MSIQDSIDRLLRLENDRPYDLWKHFQGRVHDLRGRLWTVGTWLITLLGALLALAHQADIIDIVVTFPGVVVLKPWPALAIAFLGAILCIHTFYVIKDHVDHINSNIEGAQHLLDEPKKFSRFLGDGRGPLSLVGFLFLLVYAGLFVLSLWSLFSANVAVATASAERRVTLLTINDVYRIAGVERGRRGGVARVRSLRRELETEDPELLVLHAGDIIYPSLLSRTYDGAQMIDMLNSLDGHPFAFDHRFFATFGNHEFDKRKLKDAHVLADRVEESQFTWLNSNVKFVEDAARRQVVRGLNLEESALLKVNGVWVGLFGLTIDIAWPDYVDEFDDVLEVARGLSQNLRDRDAEIVIALTHLTLQQDKEILESLGPDGPDLIIGGHEHTRQAAEVDGRWVLKADADAVSALVVHLTPRPGKPPKIDHRYWELTDDDDDAPAPDGDVDRRVRAWHSHHDALFCAKENKLSGCLDQPVGIAAVELVAEEEKIRSCETNLGNWIADQARRAFPGADAAFVNAGNLRLNQNLPPGDVLRRDVEELFQYDNKLMLIEIDRGILQKVVDHAVTGWPGNGRWLQISGFTFRHDPMAPKVDGLALLGPDGQRVEIEEDDRLRVVTVKFLLDPDLGDQDGYDMLGLDQVVKAAPSDVSLKAVVLNAFDQAGEQGVSPKHEGRIDQANAPPCTRSPTD